MDTAAIYADAVATAVREAIASAGESQLSIATATGIPRTTLARRLLGATPFTVAEVHSIASHLGIDPAAILNVRTEVA